MPLRGRMIRKQIDAGTLLLPIVLLAAGSLVTFDTASSTRAQLCGKSFAQFGIEDSDHNSIPDVVIEILAELPNGNYQKFRLKKGYEDQGWFSFKLLPKEVEELLSQSVPSVNSTDVCGNPLKQRANSTRVKTVNDLLNHNQGSLTNFGFCASEANGSVTLLRVSAPGYVTDYYLGSYLRGCFYNYSFTLNKASIKGPPTGRTTNWSVIGGSCDEGAVWRSPYRAFHRNLPVLSI